jgi:hypothetical protein
VIGSPVNFGEMTTRGQARQYFKIDFFKIVRSQNKFFLLEQSVRNSNFHPVYNNDTHDIHQGTHSGPKIKGHFAISITYSVFDPVNGSWVPCLELDDEGNVTHVGTHLEVDTAKISCPIDLSTGKPNYRY